MEGAKTPKLELQPAHRPQVADRCGGRLHHCHLLRLPSDLAHVRKLELK